MGKDGKRWSRRRFLERGAQAGAGVLAAPYVLNLAGCGDDGASGSLADGAEGSNGADAGDLAVASPGGEGGAETPDAGGVPPATPTRTPVSSFSGPLASTAVLLGVYEGDGLSAMEQAAERLDFSWLGEGESVLIKVASNSSHPHPATTSPAGVRGMVRALKTRGAGRVIVADQAGVEWVRKTATGRFSSTREMFMGNGLAALEDEAELHFFDDGAWDTGYFEATLPDGHRWPRGLYVASIVQEVDHIIYMPRISAHTLAGLTHAQKSAIGWLRDDSRNDVHKDAEDFYEKYAEINYVEEIASRFRMAVTVSEQVQLHGGPDEGTHYTMDPPLVLASTSMANHDAMAASLLVTLEQITGAEPSGMLYRPNLASRFNTAFANGALVGGTDGEAGPWLSDAPETQYEPHEFQTGITRERAVVRGWELSGGQPDDIAVMVDGLGLDSELAAGIETHGEGLYRLG